MIIKSYHIILVVKILGWFLLKWAGFGELLGWKSSTRSGNTAAQSDCYWCLNEMKLGAKRKKQDEQADIRLFFRR